MAFTGYRKSDATLPTIMIRPYRSPQLHRPAADPGDVLRTEGPSVKYRLVTRSDFDGLVCAVLLRHMDMVDDITFVHPKDVQDGVIEVSDRDILTNLPYLPL